MECQGSNERRRRFNILCPVHHADRILRLDPVISQRPEHLDSRRHAQYPIVPAAAGLCIQMRAYESRRLVIPYTRTHGEDVPHRVHGCVAPECLRLGDEPVARFFVGVAESEAGHASFGGFAGSLMLAFIIILEQ